MNSEQGCWAHGRLTGKQASEGRMERALGTLQAWCSLWEARSYERGAGRVLRSPNPEGAPGWGDQRR